MEKKKEGRLIMRPIVVITLLLLSLALIGCQKSSPAHSQQENDRNPEGKVSIYEMEGFQKVKKDRFWR